MILENAIDMEIIKSLLSLKYRNKRHEVALPPPLMQPQPVRSPENADGRNPQKSRRHSYHRPPTAPIKEKGSLIISGAKGKNNERN